MCYDMRRNRHFKIFYYMYEVVFSQELSEVSIFKSDDVLQACQFALSMHEASTEPHEIRVKHESDFVLLLKK